ncbi:MAG: transposase [Peptostreptococcus sp.]|uniref:transposase n=1 Tax=Peptostreptococcus sp. TaxID=1262 RepID=UPI00290A8DBC|nr:transposase [Peptostreptococcus sp.]MDU5680998.1 transposase [Peptostreptococcus sp.]MDU5737917.1 transposase [Peptostreptococcus sp.]
MAKGKYQEWLEPEGLLKLEGWARDGLTDEQIAKNMGVRTSTLYDWKKKYSEISESLKKGKEVVDRAVENALLKRALGYSYTETTKELVGTKMIVTKEVVKEVQPDTTAQIFWLKNRRPDIWRDRKDLEAKVDVNQQDPFKDMTKEELLKIASVEDG